MIHITITTGHRRESPRSEVRDDTIQIVHGLLCRALAGERVPVPGVPQLCTMRASAAGSALLVTIMYEGGQSAPILTMGVCAEEQDSLALWGMLHRSMPIMTDRHQPPPVPWCAARIEVGAVLHPQPTDWLGDFERCVAWGWLEMHP